MVDEAMIDAVLDDALLDGLADRPTQELRELRERCERIEADLSYRRRLLHGHMDLVRGELERRAQGSPGGPVAALLELLAGTGGGSGPAAPRSPSHQRFTVVAQEDPADLPISADLPDLDVEELRQRVEAHVAQERHLSDRRRAVLDRIDAIQQEVVRRYQRGTTSIDEILPGSA